MHDMDAVTLVIDWKTVDIYFWAPGIVTLMKGHPEVYDPPDYLRHTIQRFEWERMGRAAATNPDGFDALWFKEFHKKASS
jgi:hypothetical protein